MDNFFERPFGRIRHRCAIDVRWPNWIEGKYQIKREYFAIPEETEPELAYKHDCPPMFDNDVDVLALEFADKRNVVFVSDNDTKLGELWLRRMFRTWGDLTTATYCSEVYTYGQIHTDLLTSEMEGTGYRYRIETSARRNFDIFVSISSKDQTIALNRSHWNLKMTRNP